MASVVSKTVEICVFRFRMDRPEYLLVRRSARERLYPGLWQLVTGRLRRGERAPEAALRELQEETGLHPVRFWTASWISSFYDPSSDAVHLSPLFAAQTEPDLPVRLSAEHDEALWLPEPEARDRLVWPAQREGLARVHAGITGGEEWGRLTLLPLRPRR
ncbi:MAG: NUDIX domain-containing protein [Bacteroidota bacterium]